MPNKNHVPFCVGEYEEIDETCNGDSASRSAKGRAYCLWRDRCVAFAAYAKETNTTPDDHIEAATKKDAQGAESTVGVPSVGYKKFVVLCDEQIKRYGVEMGVAKLDPKAIPERRKGKKRPDNKTADKRKNLRPSPKARRLSIKAVKERAEERKVLLRKLFEHFKSHLVENLEGYKFTPPRGIVKTGTLYTIDRFKTSKYIAVYCKAAGTLGTPIALVYFKSRTLTLDIHLLVPYVGFGGIGQRIVKKINPQPITGGKFKTVCRGLDKEKSALVAQTIASLVKRGKIVLPPPG